MTQGVRLDHVGVIARDLPTLAAQYDRLGFLLTPLARHPDERIGNRCAMLRQGYIELLAVVDPHAASATLDRLLARHAGVHILAFGTDDVAASLARLHRAGITTATISEFARTTDDEDAAAAQARFALMQLPEQPEGRCTLVRHLTPEALWQDRFLEHANNVITLDEVVFAVDSPADSAARLSLLAGCAVVPDPAGGFALDLAHGRVRLSPACGDAGAPRVVELGVRTADGGTAIGRLLEQRAVPHRRDGASVVVGADAAGGVALRFR